MSAAFKIDNIQTFLERERVEVAFLIDNNVLMNYPKFSDWRTSLNGKVLFILTDQIPVELEYIRSKRSRSDNAEARASAHKASRAVNGLVELFKKGDIQEGINISDIGWFISVYVPKESELVAELTELDSIVKAFGPTDAKAILLIRQLNETFPALSSYFLTGDVNLCNVISVRGLPVKLLREFPIEISSDEITRDRNKRKINWDKELESIQKQMAKDVIEIELLLRAKRIIPRDYLKSDFEWSNSRITLAEGSGTVNGLTFEWSLPFSAWDYTFLRIEDTEESYPSPSFWIGKASLGFGSNQLNLEQKTIEQIASKIAECTLPFAGSLGLPCLQDTISIMKYFFYIQYMNNKLYENSEQDFKTDYIESGSFAYFGVSRVFYALACGEGILEGEDRSWDTLVDLFRILKQSWEIGERKRIIINTKIEQS